MVTSFGPFKKKKLLCMNEIGSFLRSLNGQNLAPKIYIIVVVHIKTNNFSHNGFAFYFNVKQNHETR
jgi:hypothetical protein